jgi:FixJ family two-component response regulator
MDHRTPAPRRTVLVVEDDEAVRRGLAFVLDLAGYSVETFASGEAILGRDLPDGPICLVLDERLPGVSGLETLRHVRKRRPDALGLLITTHPPAAVRSAAAAAGAPILEKPLQSETLVETISAQFASSI